MTKHRSAGHTAALITLFVLFAPFALQAQSLPADPAPVTAHPSGTPATEVSPADLADLPEPNPSGLHFDRSHHPGPPNTRTSRTSGFDWSRFLTDTARTGFQFATPRLAGGGSAGSSQFQGPLDGNSSSFGGASTMGFPTGSNFGSGGGGRPGGMSPGGMGGGGGVGGGGGMGGASIFQLGSSLLRSLGNSSTGSLGNSFSALSRISDLPSRGVSVPLKSSMFDLHISMQDLLGTGFTHMASGGAEGGQGGGPGGGPGGPGGGGSPGGSPPGGGGPGGGPPGGGPPGGGGGGRGGGAPGARVSLQLKF